MSGTEERGIHDEPAGGGDMHPTADVVTLADSFWGQFKNVLRRYRILIAAASLVALTLIGLAWWSGGTKVRIHFDEGHGIKVGDAVKYRGIVVGDVTSVRLKDDAAGVVLELLLAHEARHLAREGTQFWIERPQVSLSGVRGLETVVGAKYVELLPGPADGARCVEFTGSETPIWLSDAGATELLVEFREGWGLRVGAPLRYRSIDVGEVMGITLGDDLQSVQVRIRLTESGTHVARVGSQFWIERADISVSGVRGLDTILSGGYVAVIPGPAKADVQRYFVGLDDPPAARDRSSAGLEIVLTSSHRRGLSRGALITYRGIPVGHVLSVALAADAATVESRVYIQPQYRDLVRPESKFWPVSGFNLDAGVSGMELQLESIEALMHGGIALATPEAAGDPVSTGHRFAVADKPDDDWLQWSPTIAVGRLPLSDRQPVPSRVRLHWQTRRLGFRRDDQLLGWLLPLDSGHWMGLTDFLAPPENNREEVELEIEGEVFALPDARLTTKGPICLLRLTNWQPQQLPWPASRIRTPTDPEDCLIVSGDSSVRQPLAAGRLRRTTEGWSIDTSLSFDETDWHGACVIATADAMLVGILSVEDRVGRVVFIPPQLTAGD
jgi:hypothetical protein